MAKSKVNMSEEIRNLLSQHPDMAANDVISTLAGRGIKVQSSLVYFIKGKLKAGKQRRAKVARAARAATSSNGSIGNANAISLIRDVKALAQRAGGYENLKGLVDALAE